MKTKSDITKEIKKLEKYGYKVLTFQTNRRGRNATNGMTDYLVLGNNSIAFIEAKIGKDKLSKQQLDVQNRIKDAMITIPGYPDNLRYYLATENNIKEIITELVYYSS